MAGLADLEKRAASLMDGFNELAADLDSRADEAEGEEKQQLEEASATMDLIAEQIEKEVIDQASLARESYPGAF